MSRTSMGHSPDPEAGWEKLSAVTVLDGGDWEIHRQQQPHSADWGTYKVFASQRVAGKANYWFTRNDSTGQVGFGRDLALMRTRRPNLYDATIAAIGG